MMEDNKIFKTNEISIEISPVKNTVDSQRAQYYSYDENSGLQRIHILKDGQPLGLPEGSEIRLSAVKLSGSKQMMIYTPEIEDRVKGIVTFVIPKEFLGYSGQIRCTLYIDFSSDQTLHAGYFYINMGISDIDANLPEFSDIYWQRWADFEAEATEKMKELEGILDGEAQRLNEYADQKITEYDQKFQQTAQNIATLEQNYQDLRNDMKLSEAWAWSKNGRDRFATVYPNENLFEMDMIYYTNYINGNEFIPIISSSFGWASLFIGNDQVKTLLKPNTTYSVQYVFELLSRAAGTTPFTQTQHGTLLLHSGVSGYPSIPLGGVENNVADAATWVVGTKRERKATFTTPATLYNADANYRIVFYTMRSINPDGTLNGIERGKFYNIKFEEHTDNTIYTPNPTEDPLNAYPQYRGLSATPSDNPADYVWEESAERIKQLAQQETDKLKGEVSDIQNWIAQQGGTI